MIANVDIESAQRGFRQEVRERAALTPDETSKVRLRYHDRCRAPVPRDPLGAVFERSIYDLTQVRLGIL